MSTKMTFKFTSHWSWTHIPTLISQNICSRNDCWFLHHFVPNSLTYMCTNKHLNRFDKTTAKKWSKIFAPHAVKAKAAKIFHHLNSNGDTILSSKAISNKCWSHKTARKIHLLCCRAPHVYIDNTMWKTPDGITTVLTSCLIYADIRSIVFPPHLLN